MNHLLKILLTIFVYVTSITLFAQQSRSTWMNKPAVIDGQPAEWPRELPFYNSVTKLEYAIANDSANLYVCLRVADEQTGLRIFRGGLNIWLDPSGKKKESIGIGFPLKAGMPKEDMPAPGEIQGPGSGYRKRDFNQLKASIALHQVNIKVRGFFGVPDQVMPLANGYGITAAFAWDSLNTLCIEYKIPIVLVLRHNLSATDTTQAIGIGFVENALDSGGFRGGGNTDDGGSGGWNSGNGGMNGGGGMPPGGMRGGMGGPAPGGMGTTTQEQKVWTKFILAYMY